MEDKEKDNDKKQEKLKLLIIFVFSRYEKTLVVNTIEVAIRQLDGKVLVKIIKHLEEEDKEGKIEEKYFSVEAEWSVFSKDELLDSGTIRLK